MKRCLLFLVVCNVVLLGFNPEAMATLHTDISIEVAYGMIFPISSLAIIDVREPFEYIGPLGHIPGAYNYPWTSGVFEDLYQDFSINDEILVVCLGGSRSNAAAEFLDLNGYLHVYDMIGGTRAWESAGYPTVPEPATLALLALGAVAIRRRKA
jgi:rhodanese-related sulfurtransferase